MLDIYCRAVALTKSCPCGPKLLDNYYRGGFATLFRSIGFFISLPLTTSNNKEGVSTTPLALFLPLLSNDVDVIRLGTISFDTFFHGPIKHSTLYVIPSSLSLIPFAYPMLPEPAPFDFHIITCRQQMSHASINNKASKTTRQPKRLTFELLSLPHDTLTCQHWPL